jgi:hypothetical protein
VSDTTAAVTSPRTAKRAAAAAAVVQKSGLINLLPMAADLTAPLNGFISLYA